MSDGKMVLWECEYTLDCEYWTDKSVDFWYSTTPITIETQQQHWDKIHPGGYTVSDFTVKRANLPEDEMPQNRLLERIYKERGI